jgi:hypothetical protein
MKRSIARLCWAAAGALALAAAGLAQQRFPERPGDWEFTLKSDSLPEPTVVRMCLTDETWAKALMQNPLCKISEVSVTSKIFHYKLDCVRRTGESHGDVEMTFDGPEHMIGRSTITTTVGGKTTTMTMQLDYRWKGAVCTDADVNMRKKSGN